AGAELLFVEAPESLEEIHAIPRLVSAPQLIKIVVGGRTPAVPREDLAASGFSLVLYANTALQGAVHGMQQALRGLMEAGILDE
ncbi:carboxyvinyl-carboxyphosphonate phosphorylmutase, partial [Escherichia coli]|uniref:hypothetical protein n=1 Tax=Escherichia coli TaxID=562 RepID=UPI00182A4BDF